MEDKIHSHSPRQSSEGCSLEPPRLQLQRLEAQDKQVTVPKGRGFTELSWTPVSARKQPVSFPHHPLPPSHSPAPIAITSGRSIVILPIDYTHPIGHSHEFLSGINASLFCFQSRSLADLHYPTPAPIITPVDDDSLNMEHMVPVRQFGVAKAIEFTQEQCIVPGRSEVDTRSKEESMLTVDKQASLDTSYVNISKPQELNTIPKSPSVTDLGKASLSPMPNNVPANSIIKTPLPNPTSSSPIRLGVESRSETTYCSSSQQVPAAHKLSSVGVSPLIMSCYEETKEQLVLDDSDSELEMPECSKSISCTPQHSADQSISESGTDLQIHDSNTNSMLAPMEDSAAGDESKSNSYGPPPKRAKVVDTSTKDLNSSIPDEYKYTAAGSGMNQDLAAHSSIAIQESSTIVTESSQNFGQTVPNESLLFPEPFGAGEPANTSSILASVVPDHSLKLECPHEPEDVASDGKDTVDQMLPVESAREHAMVPNFVRCDDDDNQRNDDRDEPNDDDGRGSTHLEAYVPAVDLDLSHPESLEDVQAKMVDNLLPGYAQTPETADGHVPEISVHPVNSTDVDVSAKSQIDVCSPTITVPTIMLEPSQHSIEHQIVPGNFTNNNTPSSSQSLYTDQDFHEKCHKPRVQNESNIDGLYSPQVLAVSLDSIGKRWDIAATLSHSNDQALPVSPSQLSQQYCSKADIGGSPVGVNGCYGLDSDEQEHSNGQSCGPFGFRLGKRTPCSDSSGNSIPTTRLNLGRPHLRLGLSKRQQCTPLHRPKRN